ncbi:hypothetical protein GMORB2_5117 [Geosmithia morbida]|uniref:Uncharacterized protein n=1 Tax=Geosmithia morbida TaxID=1094350 RepID=A0A9P4YZ72_9HYPO|nr:uncharacterized protein GMORB2_5117 [Geosmithia morbida]KAF4124451.1 hypothetical protein GMORB2_5117 [Geosmithia morbida]
MLVWSHLFITVHLASIIPSSPSMDYKELYEQAERRRQEAERRQQEAERKQQEAERRQQEAERDAIAAADALRTEREENARTQFDRTMEAYLLDIDSMHEYIQRLIPTPAKKSSTLSEGQKSQSSTSGRTSIFGKYYPLKIRPWDDFRHLYRDAFERARVVIGDSLRFPSILDMRAARRNIDEQLPPAFLESESFRNEAKTSYIIHEALQRPAQHVMNAYLNAAGSQVQLYFDNRSTGWHVRVSQTVDAETSSDMQGDESDAGDVAQKLPRKMQPDCLVLASRTISPSAEEGQGKHAGELRSVYRVLMGEHKPVHRIRAKTLSRLGQRQLPEDIMVQLAKAKNKTQHGGASDVDETHGLKLPSGQIYFANALSQTFHYMLSQDDPTTLLVHSEVYPQYCQMTADQPDPPQEDTRDIRELPVSQLCGLCLLAYESIPEPARQRSINVSQLALFPELPSSLPPGSSSSRVSSVRGRRRRRDDGDDDDDDAGGGHGSHGSPPNGGSSPASQLQPSAHQPRKSSPLKRQRSASHQSPRHHAMGSGEVHDRKKRRVVVSPTLPSPFDPSTFRPIRPYCTQACLRGLIRGEDMDYSCPNVLLHRHACRLKGPRWARHAITGDELRELVRYQLFENSELDCQCLLDDGAWGAVGCLFKITVTGFGYTLVAKGVETLYHRRLRHEVEVYDKLDAQQGLLIPVCLGMIKLILPYPMVNCTLVTHMLLMSYAGEPLYHEPLRQELERIGIDADEEEWRTTQELRALGLIDDDDLSDGNVMWCAETKRAMKIDFDQAYVLTVNSDQVRKTSTPSRSTANGELLSGTDQDDHLRGFRGSPSYSTVDCLLLA